MNNIDVVVELNVDEVATVAGIGFWTTCAQASTSGVVGDAATIGSIGDAVAAAAAVQAKEDDLEVDVGEEI